jgi:phage tail protein X
MKRYKNIPITKTVNGKEIYQTTKYPSPPVNDDDLYVITQDEDRFDSLAFEYYGDATLWWVMSSANPNLPQNSYFPPVGVTLRIPSNLGNVLLNFEKING